MSEENPYRYEGTAEALEKPREQEGKVQPPSKKGLFFSSLFAAFLVALYFPLFVRLLLLPFFFLLLLFVIYPIGEFIFHYARKQNRRKALLRFWIAAAKVAVVYLVLILFFDFVGISLIGIASPVMIPTFLIGFGSQLSVASAVLFFMTRAR